ncbi:acyl-CoA thioesterase [Flavobacterium sp. W21_SRS_FM6]|uniref:acyl-CoA thioesterase n=1 Tax=Flavobacterium sp. W21_SRS_FM6 TaxID=3240268 RepID=UPI003F92515B
MDQQAEFSLLIRVRYAECDAQQVVFNARYGDYVDLAITEYMRYKIGGFQKLLERGLDNQVVNLTIDFRSSAVFDDVLELRVIPIKFGHTSYRYSVTIRQFATLQTVVEAQVTYVLVDAKTFQKTPLTPWLIEQLSREAPPIQVNQAGIDLT